MKNMEFDQTTILISLEQKYRIYLDERSKQYQILDLSLFNPAKLTNDHLNLFGCYSIKKLTRIIEISNSNDDFLPILGVNIQRVDRNYMFLSALLRPFAIISLRQLIKIIKITKEANKQAIRLLHYFKGRLNELWERYSQELQVFNEDCIDYFLVQYNNVFKIIIGFTNFHISKQDKDPQSLTNDIQTLLHSSSDENIKQLQNGSIPVEYVQALRSTKIAQIEISTQNYYNLDIFFSKYAQNYNDFLTESLQYGFTQFLYQYHKRKTLQFNILSISMNDKKTNKTYQGEIYHNLKCRHFQGITLETFLNSSQCPICGNQLLYDKNYMQDYCQNVFQALLLSNFMNPFKNDISYYFKENVFTLKLKEENKYCGKFSNYFHFKLYIEKCKHIQKRNEISLINNYETITFYNKLNKSSKFYSYEQFIGCPVRGKYCRHWEFYDLRRVYSKIIDSKDGYFQCFVCCQDIHCEELIYLREMKQIIDVTQSYILMELSKDTKVNTCLKLNHEKQECELIIYTQSNQIKIKLNLYKTMKCPLLKSRFDAEIFASKQIQLPKSFLQYFYGI